MVLLNIEKLLALRCCRRYPFKELFENYLNSIRNNRDLYILFLRKYGFVPSVLTPSLAKELLKFDSPYKREFLREFKQKLNHVKKHTEKYSLNEVFNFDNSILFNDLLWFAPGYVSSERDLEERLYYYLSYNYDVYRQYSNGSNKYDIYIPGYIVELKVISNSHDLYRYIGQVRDYVHSNKKVRVYGLLYLVNNVNLNKIKSVDVPTIIKYSPELIISLLF